MQSQAHRVGAVLYAIWGLLHLKAALQVYELGAGLERGLVQGRIYQDAWNLAYFALFSIVVAVMFNWKNSRLGYWLNLVTVSVTDVGFILAVLAPGHIPLFPGVMGPAFWILATIFSTVGIRAAAR